MSEQTLRPTRIWYLWPVAALVAIVGVGDAISGDPWGGAAFGAFGLLLGIVAETGGPPMRWSASWWLALGLFAVMVAAIAGRYLFER
jgi:hypothetical protein